MYNFEELLLYAKQNIQLNKLSQFAKIFTGIKRCFSICNFIFAIPKQRYLLLSFFFQVIALVFFKKNATIYNSSDWGLLLW